MKYVRVYFSAGTNTIKHVACKNTPFSAEEGISEDGDADLDRVEYALDDIPELTKASHLLRALSVDGQGRARINLADARREIPNVQARGHTPLLTAQNNHQRTRIAKGRVRGG